MANEVLVTIGQAITRNVRTTDIVCRCGDQRFAVALLRCPMQFGGRVGERVTANVTRLILEGSNSRYGSRLRLAWWFATLPDEAPTPVELLHVAEESLDQVIVTRAG